MKDKVGVVIGRFQVPSLHRGHEGLFRFVAESHDQILVIVGNCDGPRSDRYPMPFQFVRDMLTDEFEGYGGIFRNKHFEIIALCDVPDDRVWSQHVDHLILSHYPMRGAIIYGGRDSCLDSYHGRFQTVNVDLPDRHEYSGTAVRAEVAKQLRSNLEMRNGAIHAVMNLPRQIFPTVDVAVVNKNNQVLLGRRAYGGWRFPGGYVDFDDKSLEDAARRELREETGIANNYLMEFISSRTMSSHRNSGKSKVLTTFFLIDLAGDCQPVAGDDLSEVKWFSLSEIQRVEMAVDHEVLRDDLLVRLGIKLLGGSDVA